MIGNYLFFKTYKTYEHYVSKSVETANPIRWEGTIRLPRLTSGQVLPRRAADLVAAKGWQQTLCGPTQWVGPEGRRMKKPIVDC